MFIEPIDLILEIKMFGIHGNHECIRCGACCVYFHIFAEKPEHGLGFKIAGERCKYLTMDSEGVASCSSYQGDRPVACKRFFCHIGNLLLEDCVGLKQTAQELRREALVAG